MEYYDDIKNKLIDNEMYSRVKDYSKERNKIKTYYEIEAGKHYGEIIIKEYSKKLIIELNKKYNERTLRRFRQFYLFNKNRKWSTLSTNLVWSHYVELLSINDTNKINYYISIIEKYNLSIRELRKRIKNKEYERLPQETKNKLIIKQENKITDLIKNPIIIKNNNNYKVINEKTLQKIILEDIESFMKELGNGFSYISSEYKIKIGNSYNYIDLLLFNIDFNCYVVIELKTTSLKKEHIGQIEVYMNYIDKNIKSITHDKTIGIIICKEDNKLIIEYSSDKRIVARYYEIK